ncbi:protein S100-A12 [Echinops telfairi]|uniref:Protein S100 n=1 Tax=Echinops telfairi TaxID=9371 RepID=A0ABM0J9C5_ECHTE|nr:protein S100-A12 [Echinops telfairi]
MTKMEEHLEGLLNIFHQHSVRLGHVDTLTKGEMRQLIPKELPNTLKNTKNPSANDKIFQELDTDRDGQIDFREFIAVVARLMVNAHDSIHKE